MTHRDTAIGLLHGALGFFVELAPDGRTWVVQRKVNGKSITELASDREVRLWDLCVRYKKKSVKSTAAANRRNQRAQRQGHQRRSAPGSPPCHDQPPKEGSA